MTRARHSIPPLFSQVDVSTGSAPRPAISPGDDFADVLREILSAQERTNELLEQLAATVAATQKQRASELHQWRKTHPALSVACRKAAEALTRVQIEYLERLTEEINDTSDDMIDGDFMLNEFVDRYGPRLAHLNGVIHVLAQLSNVPNPADSQR
jgi:hypothetical protein